MTLLVGQFTGWKATTSDVRSITRKQHSPDERQMGLKRFGTAAVQRCLWTTACEEGSWQSSPARAATSPLC